MTAALYNRDILRLALRLDDYRDPDGLEYVVERRTKTCGSHIRLGVSRDADGRVIEVGIAPHMCALGQAAAAIFASHAQGRSAAEIATARNQLSRWLGDNDAPAPDWPEIMLLSPARKATSRHQAVLLAFEAGAQAATGE